MCCTFFAEEMAEYRVDYQQLRISQEEIQSFISPVPVAISLFSKGIITSDEEAYIKHQSLTQVEKVDRLIKTVLTKMLKNEKALPEFLNSLRDSEQDHIVKTIEDNGM